MKALTAWRCCCGLNEATDGAQNALLKTLEEPNERVVLLVTADEPENLLPTIASRCELLRLRPMPLDELAQALVEKKSLDAEKATTDRAHFRRAPGIRAAPGGG